MKQFSASLSIGEMQIYIYIFHLTTITMAIIKKTAHWTVVGKKGTLIYGWLECKLIQPLWKSVWRLLKKFTIEIPYDLAIQLLGIHHKNQKLLI
jgi:hypothetical protein